MLINLFFRPLILLFSHFPPFFHEIPAHPEGGFLSPRSVEWGYIGASRTAYAQRHWGCHPAKATIYQSKLLHSIIEASAPCHATPRQRTNLRSSISLICMIPCELFPCLWEFLLCSLAFSSILPGPLQILHSHISTFFFFPNCPVLLFCYSPILPFSHFLVPEFSYFSRSLT